MRKEVSESKKTEQRREEEEEDWIFQRWVM